MSSCLTFWQYRRGCRLYCYNFHIRIFRFQIFTDTGNGSACSYTGNKNIHFSFGILPNFRTGRTLMCTWIQFIDKLSRNETVWNLFCQLISFRNSTFHSLRTIGQNKFSAIRFHQVAALHAHRLWHCNNNTNTKRCSNRSKTDSCITACRLNDNGIFCQFPCL